MVMNCSIEGGRTGIVECVDWKLLTGLNRLSSIPYSAVRVIHLCPYVFVTNNILCEWCADNTRRKWFGAVFSDMMDGFKMNIGLQFSLHTLAPPS